MCGRLGLRVVIGFFASSLGSSRRHWALCAVVGLLVSSLGSSRCRRVHRVVRRPLVVSFGPLSLWLVHLRPFVSSFSHPGCGGCPDLGFSGHWGRGTREGQKRATMEIVARSPGRTGWASHFLGPPLVTPSPVCCPPLSGPTSLY